MIERKKIFENFCLIFKITVIMIGTVDQYAAHLRLDKQMI